ncbi:MAG: VOC family protein [Kiloniellaceae bacterium]
MTVIAKKFGANAEHAKLRTCLGFNGNGHEAAEFYVSLLPDSFIESAFTPQENAPPLVIEFTLAGAPYMILNAGPKFVPSPAASISVLTKDQAETDRLWEALTADGGEEGHCAWLTDRYGVFWQIVPEILPTLFSADDKAAAGRAFQAMMQMRKIDIAAVQAAFDNT